MVAKERRRIRHNFTDDEMAALREEFTDTSLRRADEELAFAPIRKEWKDRIGVLQMQIDERAMSLRNRFEEHDVECALVPNFDNGMMEFWDLATGAKVDERRLRPDEKQTNILQAMAA